ncbi:MAG: hypothetical protein ACOYVK_00870 [Bacillota bacterium]
MYHKNKNLKNDDSLTKLRKKLAMPVRKLADIIEGDNSHISPVSTTQPQANTHPNKKIITEEDMIRKIKFQLSIPIHEGESTSISKFMDYIIQQEIKSGKENATRQLQYKYTGLLNNLLMHLESESKVRSEHTINNILAYLENEKV